MSASVRLHEPLGARMSSGGRARITRVSRVACASLSERASVFPKPPLERGCTIAVEPEPCILRGLHTLGAALTTTCTDFTDLPLH
jgi:hypothetical protein